MSPSNANRSIAKLACSFSLIILGSIGAADAMSRPPQVAVAIEGIGFSYVPHLKKIECIRTSCVVIETLDRTRVMMRYPSDLDFSGSECPTNDWRNGFDFRLAATPPIETSRSIAFQLESSTCPGRYIEFTFSARNRSDPQWIGSEVMQKIKSLIVCVLTSNKSLQCNEKPLITDAEEQRIFAAATAWAGRKQTSWRRRR